MELQLRKRQVDLPHLLFLTAIAVFTAWYLNDARQNSMSFQDLLLVQPIAILIFCLYPVILWQIINPATAEKSETVVEKRRMPRKEAIRVFGSMALLILYSVALPWAGFDLATVVYVFASLFLLGERRLFVLVGLPVIFTTIVIVLFTAVLQMPLPLFLGKL